MLFRLRKGLEAERGTTEIFLPPSGRLFDCRLFKRVNVERLDTGRCVLRGAVALPLTYWFLFPARALGRGAGCLLAVAGAFTMAGLFVSKFLVLILLPAMSPEYARSFRCRGREKFAHTFILRLEMNERDAERGDTVRFFFGGFRSDVEE